jgi:hypothetical protein
VGDLSCVLMNENVVTMPIAKTNHIADH